MEQAQVYTVKDIMDILSISKNSAYYFIRHDPPFKVIRIGDTYRIPKDSFDSWLKTNK